MRIFLTLLLLGIPDAARALPPLGEARCEVKGDMFVLDVGRTKVPTYAAVILPDERLLRLKYGPEAIDTLGAGYAKGNLRVQLSTLAGVNSKSQREKVFTVPGTYHFILQDANTAEGMQLHRLECSVMLAKSPLNDSGA